MWMFLCSILFVLNTVIDSKHLGIYDGEPADIKEVPYIVQVNVEGGYVCSGVIIDATTVLTPTHCIMGENLRNINCGSSKLGEGDSIEIYDAIYNKEYHPLLVSNDIGLLKLSTPLTFSETVQPIKLPKAGDIAPENKWALVAGWGEISDSEMGLSPVLLKANITILADSFCSKHYESYQGSVEICAGLKDGGRGPCWRDSGAPLVIDGILHGIFSWRLGCSQKEYHAIFTKISAFTAWINENR